MSALTSSGASFISWSASATLAHAKSNEPIRSPSLAPYSLSTSVKNETTFLTVSGHELRRKTKWKASAVCQSS